MYLVVNSIWEFFGGAIAVFFLFYFIYLFYCFLSKIFNTGISYRGKTGITPTDLDDHIKFLKKNGSIIYNKIISLKKGGGITASNKIELLNKINELYSKKIITYDEYLKLKKKIIE
jgi:hypothetical protein